MISMDIQRQKRKASRAAKKNRALLAAYLRRAFLFCELQQNPSYHCGRSRTIDRPDRHMRFGTLYKDCLKLPLVPKQSWITVRCLECAFCSVITDASVRAKLLFSTRNQLNFSLCMIPAFPTAVSIQHNNGHGLEEHCAARGVRRCPRGLNGRSSDVCAVSTPHECVSSSAFPQERGPQAVARGFGRHEREHEQESGGGRQSGRAGGRRCGPLERRPVRAQLVGDECGARGQRRGL